MKKLIILPSLFFALFFFSSCNNDPCKEVVCINGGACLDGGCLCPVGFSGEHCETPTSDPCASVSCLNGGICVTGTCFCPNGFTGPNCATAVDTSGGGGSTTGCDDVTCLNGGICNDGSCFCPDGYTGPNCEFTVPDSTLMPCDTISCLNGGSCIDGDCHCEDGFSGTRCETRVSTQFVGTYSVTGSFTGTVHTFSCTVSESPTEITKILFDNLYDLSGSHGITTPIFAWVASFSSSFTIPTQVVTNGTDSYEISGYGSITGTTLSLSYTVYTPSGTFLDDCDSSYIRD